MKNMTKKRICIDAGHGGSDLGAINNGMKEADITLEVTRILGLKLESAGFDIIYTRPDMNGKSTNSRWQYANTQGADYYISIHVNAGRGTGVETFYFRNNTERSNRSENFAHYVNNFYAETMSLRNRGVKPDTQTHIGSIGVLRHTRMPAILIELAFIDSPLNNPDVFILQNRHNDMASALLDGILRYSSIETSNESEEATSVLINSTLTLDILGNEQQIRGFIENGETFVRLTEFTSALGFATTWDAQRHIPVVSNYFSDSKYNSLS